MGQVKSFLALVTRICEMVNKGRGGQEKGATLFGFFNFFCSNLNYQIYIK